MTARVAFRQAWRFLTRLSIAAVLIAILLSLTVLGSCFPQLSTTAPADAGQLTHWRAGVQTRYGPLTDALAATGMFRWFSSPVFLVSLSLLAAATLVCTLDRWGVVWRRALRYPAVTSDLAFRTAPHRARLTDLPPADLPGILHKRLKEHGFHTRSESAGAVLCVRGDRNRLAFLGTLVTHTALLLLLLGTSLSSVFGWRQELRLEANATAEVAHESRTALRNEGFTIQRYVDGSVAAYQAHVAVIEEGREVMRGNIGVNQPLAYNHIGFYLRSYGEREGDYNLTLLAVRDPGYGLVIAAGFLLLFGLTVSFYFPRCWIQARMEEDGTLHLAGWAERRACEFGREFTALVEATAHKPSAGKGWKNGRMED